MTIINAEGMDSRAVNTLIAASDDNVTVNNCFGIRFLCAGMDKGKKVTLDTICGNALGAYLNGGEIEVNASTQDAVGDTMDSGAIIIRGNAGDALGYAMRGGKIYVQGNSGYRTGVHMKECGEHKPVIVIGGKVGSFLGEYQAGGVLVVLNMHDEKPMYGFFTGTGIHGGKIYLRTSETPENLPAQVAVSNANGNDMEELKPILEDYSATFELDADKLVSSHYYVLKPNNKNPYTSLYTVN